MKSLFHKIYMLSKKYCRPITAILFSIYGLYLRYLRLAEREQFMDEICQLNNTLGPLKPFWKRLSYGEVTCFPGDYVLTFPFVQIFKFNKWGIAIPHIIATIIGFYLLYLICNKYLKTYLGFVITFAVACFNVSMIYHAFEFRSYPVLITISLATFYFSEMIVCRINELSKIKKFLIGFFFVFTVWFHAYGVIILFVCMLYFLIYSLKEKPFTTTLREISPFVLKFSVFALPIFLWYATGSKLLNYEIFHDQMNMNTFDFVPNPLVDLNGFLHLIFSELVGFKAFDKLIYGIPISFMLLHKDSFKQMGFFLLLIILPIELKILSDLHTGYWFVTRQFSWTMPLFAFLLGWCWDSIFIYLKESLKRK